MKAPGGRGRDRAGLAFGVSPRRVRDAQELLRLDAAAADGVLAGRVKLSKALAAAKKVQQEALISRTVVPEGRYRTIVVDPPWKFDDTGCQGAAALHYTTMTDEAVAALSLADLADERCHIYLWTVASKLEAAFAALKAWGFTYKTTLVWRKNRLGLGRYFRSQTEFVLFAVKGRVQLRRADLSNVIEAPITKHSSKPDAFYELAEKGSFEPRIDLFARVQRPGWTCWGAEVPEDAGATTHEAPSTIKPASGGSR